MKRRYYKEQFDVDHYRNSQQQPSLAGQPT